MVVIYTTRSDQDCYTKLVKFIQMLFKVFIQRIPWLVYVMKNGNDSIRYHTSLGHMAQLGWTGERYISYWIRIRAAGTKPTMSPSPLCNENNNISRVPVSFTYLWSTKLAIRINIEKKYKMKLFAPRRSLLKRVIMSNGVIRTEWKASDSLLTCNAVSWKVPVHLIH